MSRRGSGRRTGRLGTRLALVCGGVALLGAALLVVLMVQTFAPHMGAEQQDTVRKGWIFGLLIAVVLAGGVALVAFLQAGAIGSRLTDLGLAVSKLGRGGTEVRVRFSGNDEVSAVGRALQYLASDLAAIAEEAQKGGGTGATMDPDVREMRDRTLPDRLAQPEGYEVDGQIGAGSRGGMDYFGSIEKDGKTVVYAVSGEGAGAMAVLALRTARDEIVRALNAGATARKTLAHTNRVMHRTMPGGSCAKASLLELGDDEVKLYQAGYRTPLWICSAGEVLEISAEGLALGLDEGPVFEKGLRSEKIPVRQGVRLVQTNEAGSRMQDLLDLVQEHSPKHTAPFMNLVLGAIEGDAGADGLREDVLLVTVKRF